MPACAADLKSSIHCKNRAVDDDDDDGKEEERATAAAAAATKTAVKSCISVKSRPWAQEESDSKKSAHVCRDCGQLGKRKKESETESTYYYY